jgi:hypothetical protein
MRTLTVGLRDGSDGLRRRRGASMRHPRSSRTMPGSRAQRIGRYGLLTGTAFAAFLALVSCSSSPAASSGKTTSGKSSAPVNVNLVLDWTWQPYHVPFMYGIAHGIYRSHGINLTLTSTSSASPTRPRPSSPRAKAFRSRTSWSSSSAAPSPPSATSPRT